MKLTNGTISIFVGQEGTTIELYDRDSATTFVSIELTPQQLCSALSRLAHTPCDIEVHGLHKLGKKMETSKYEFEIPDNINTYEARRGKQLMNHAKKVCPEGWEPDLYFGSQGSFFEKNGKSWARDTMRKWELLTDQNETK